MISRADYARMRIERLTAKIMDLEARDRSEATKKALKSSRLAIKRWVGILENENAKEPEEDGR